MFGSIQTVYAQNPPKTIKARKMSKNAEKNTVFGCFKYEQTHGPQKYVVSVLTLHYYIL